MAKLTHAHFNIAFIFLMAATLLLSVTCAFVTWETVVSVSMGSVIYLLMFTAPYFLFQYCFGGTKLNVPQTIAQSPIALAIYMGAIALSYAALISKGALP